jgi:hypothetical protein
MNAPLLHTPTGVWSAERIDQLCRHFALGLTAAESAVLIGGVTGNAVTSKRLRLGLCVRRTEPHSTLATMLAACRVRHPVEPPRFLCDPLPAMDGALPPDARPSRLVDRRPGECAWPLGPTLDAADHNNLSCCAPIEGRRSYCPAHALLSRRRS